MVNDSLADCRKDIVDVVTLAHFRLMLEARADCLEDIEPRDSPSVSDVVDCNLRVEDHAKLLRPLLVFLKEGNYLVTLAWASPYCVFHALIH